MKGIITAALVLLAALTTQGQSLYATAHSFQLGVIDQVSDNIEWIGDMKPVEILVQVNYGELIIYSEEHQVYQIIQQLGSNNGTTMYKAKDKKGNNCWVFITTIDDDYYGEEEIAVTLRYSDYAWMYLCTENK